MHKLWKWKLTWTGFKTSQVFFTVSTRSTTEQHRNITARPTSTRSGTANPKCLTCTRAEIRKRCEAAPNLLQWVSHPGGSARQAPIDNTRLTGGTYFNSTSFRVKTPNKPTEEVGGKWGKPVNKSWLGCKIFGPPLSTNSPNLGPRTGFGRTQELWRLLYHKEFSSLVRCIA